MHFAAHEFDPRLDGTDVYKVAAWLKETGAMLSLLDSCDLGADSLVVADFNNGGEWHVPLQQPLYFINETERREALRLPPTLSFTPMNDNRPARISVLHTDIDDEPHKVEVDLSLPITFRSYIR
jgi:hypothetical protein